MKDENRSISARDARAVNAIIVKLHRWIYSTQIDSLMIEDLIKRLNQDGLSPPVSSAGQLIAATADLVERIEYAAGEIDELLPPRPHMTAYTSTFPSRSAADQFADRVSKLGALKITFDEDDGDFTVYAEFPHLPPDPDHHKRMLELRLLSEKLSGQLTGWQSASRNR